MAWPTTPVETSTGAVRRTFGLRAAASPVLEPTRSFNDGTATDRIITAIGNCNRQGEVTMAAVVRVPEAPDSIDQAIMALSAPGGGGYILRLNAAGDLEVEGNGSDSTASGQGIPVNDHWHFVAFTLSPVGEPDFWVYDLTDQEWVALAMEGLGELSFPEDMDSVAFGEDGNGNERGLRFDIAAAVVFPAELSSTEIGDLIAAAAFSEWLTYEAGPNTDTPSGLWLFDQTSTTHDLLDRTGNGADETSSSGTKVLVEAPPIPYGEDGVIEGGKPPTSGQLFPRGV